MYFDSISAALIMEGHGIFVWPAYLIAVAALAMLFIVPRRRERRFLSRLAGEMQRQQAQSDRAGEQ